MMNTLLGMGLAGGAVLALWLSASRILKNRLPARWHYRILKTSLFFFLVPVGRLLPLAGRVLSALRPAPAVIPAPAPVQTAPDIPVAVLPRAPVTAPAVSVPAPDPAPFSVTAETLHLLAAVWAVGAAAMLAYKLWVYLRLRRRVFRQSRPVSSHEARLVFWSCKRQMGIHVPVELLENPAARSPFAAGLLRPAVVIPAVDLGREELRYLFLHELTHIRCGDLWVRFAAMLAQVIHWYNPLAWLLCRSIQTVSEQSCDERVACPLPPEERYVYGNVILKLAANAAAGSGDWAATLSARESMERRLTRVLKTEKLRGYKRLLALALAVAILACGGGAALAVRNPLSVSGEAGEPARTVPTLPAEDGTAGEANGGGEDALPTNAVPTSGTFPAPTEEQVLAAREAALEGMAEKQVERLKLVVREANYGWEFDYLYRNVFAVLEDPDALYWNCFDQKGEIQIAWAVDGDIDMDAVCADEGLTEDEFYAKYGTPVVSDNQYDTNDFTAILDELIAAVRNEDLKAALRYVRDEARLAADQHAVEHANNEYRALHDLDYFLLRYGPADVGPYVEDASTVSKYYGTLGAFYGAPAPVESETAGDGKAAGRPVAAGGTPSEAFLKELRAHFAALQPDIGITESTPVLFGDRELILKRGGTLLPDEEFDSYTVRINYTDDDFTEGEAVICKGYLSKLSDPVSKTRYFLDEYEIGNKEAYFDNISSASFNKLDQLVDGEYPRNSKGETYGSSDLALINYVGYPPDLECIGHFPHVNSPLGYIRHRDECALLFLPEEECPHKYTIPLYNAEGEVIGKYKDIKCSGHPDSISKMSAQEARAALAGEPGSTPTYGDPSANTLALIRMSFQDQGATLETPVLFGSPELIRSRGGTLYPDNDINAYRMREDGRIHKVFLDRNGQLGDEYLVGNRDAVDAREVWMVDTLTPDGDYPKNSRGESYGHGNLADYVGYWPDLEYLAEYPHEGRPAGYIYSRDDASSPLNRYDPNAAEKPRTRTDSEAYQAWRAEHPGARFIPLYDSEGEIIGTYDYGPGTGVDTAGMSVEEAKAALENPA